MDHASDGVNAHTVGFMCRARSIHHAKVRVYTRDRGINIYVYIYIYIYILCQG